MVVHPYNKAQNSQGQKLFHKRFITETLKSTQLVNHINNPFIAHDSYFPKIMTVPISESNPKNPMSICFIESRIFFFLFFCFLFFFNKNKKKKN